MPESRSWQRWFFFLLVTLLLAVPVATSYVLLARDLKAAAHAQHLQQINNQLNQLQEQLNDVKWDALADTYDDTLHLGSRREAELLAETLMWYVYPDGRCFVDGIAVVNPDGSLRPSRQAAVIDSDGNPLPPKRIAQLKREHPWLESPWLPSYRFLAQVFKNDPERDFYVSPFIKAPGRLVFVVASAKRNQDGVFEAAVVLQHSIPKLWKNIIASAAKGLNLWLMDRRGNIGLSTTALARASAEAFHSSGELERVLQKGKAAAERGKYGAVGSRPQKLADADVLLCYRSEGNNLVMGVVETQTALGALGLTALTSLGGVAVLSLILLALAGAVYTLAALRRERASVEKATLRRYTGTVSHQVRNHLVTLQGSLEMIAVGRVMDQQKIKEMLGGPCQSALQGIQQTVEELEALSRGEMDLDYDGQMGGSSMYRIRTHEEKDKEA